MNHFQAARKNLKILAAFSVRLSGCSANSLARLLRALLHRFLLVFLAAAVLAALLDRRAADFFADLLTVLFGLLLAFAARFRAGRFLREARAAAIGGTIMGSETR